MHVAFQLKTAKLTTVDIIDWPETCEAGEHMSQQHSTQVLDLPTCLPEFCTLLWAALLVLGLAQPLDALLEKGQVAWPGLQQPLPQFCVTLCLLVTVKSLQLQLTGFSILLRSEQHTKFKPCTNVTNCTDAV